MSNEKQVSIKTETKAVTTQEKTITDEVMLKVREMEKMGDLQLPQGYSYSNALKSAWLILQETVDRDKKPVLQSCSKASITYALLDLVIQGLSPAKKQCYFIPYGGKLTLSRSYMGTVAVTKRLKGVKNVIANCIYEGDEFAYQLDLDTGEKKITKHEQSFENIDNTKILGAYAIVVTEEGIPNHVEVMNINQIKKSWNQGAAKGNSGAHTNFTDQMCCKTVINRCCKMFINTSDDSDILIEAMNRSEEKEYDEKDIVANVVYEVKGEVEQKGNKKSIDIEPEPQKTPVVEAEIVEEKQEEMGGPGF